MDEMNLDREYRRGDSGPRVRVIQEWLTLHGYGVPIDGDFASATESAVTTFQRDRGMAASGAVNTGTYAALVAPMQAARSAIPADGRTLSQLVVEYALQHLSQHPREAGGDNQGPWVRLYMDGHEGTEWRWCAGFVCYVLQQACKSLGVAMPVRKSFSCDSLALSATANGILVSGASHAITPGCVFLVRRTADDWTHTGIVIERQAESFLTVEGNTNDAGDANGYEVCRRTRSYSAKDFILVR